MNKGNVKWYDSNKRFGFITPDNGAADVFVHVSAVEAAGLSGLKEGQSVQYEIDSSRGRPAAVNLTLS